jgi:hypothetical protein
MGSPLRAVRISTCVPHVPRCSAHSTAIVLVTLVVLLLFAPSARAYRPFDGTDADTAELGSFELELGPVHYYRQGPQNFLIAPNLVLNFGILPDTELVIDASNYVALGTLTRGTARDSFLEDDILMKHTFREGVLQGKTGVSIAAEGGLLTPEINGVTDIGASIDVITSYRWSFGTFHWNEWFEYTRDHHADLYTGVILEGPHDWRLRPVAELYYDKDFEGTSTESALLGAIWTLRESFVLDAAVRGARVAEENALEVRLGLTWAMTMWEPKEEKRE